MALYCVSEELKYFHTILTIFLLLDIIPIHWEGSLIYAHCHWRFLEIGKGVEPKILCETLNQYMIYLIHLTASKKVYHSLNIERVAAVLELHIHYSLFPLSIIQIPLLCSHISQLFAPDNISPPRCRNRSGLCPLELATNLGQGFHNHGEGRYQQLGLLNRR